MELRRHRLKVHVSLHRPTNTDTHRLHLAALRARRQGGRGRGVVLPVRGQCRQHKRLAVAGKQRVKDLGKLRAVSFGLQGAAGGQVREQALHGRQLA